MRPQPTASVGPRRSPCARTSVHTSDVFGFRPARLPTASRAPSAAGRTPPRVRVRTAAGNCAAPSGRWWEAALYIGGPGKVRCPSAPRRRRTHGRHRIRARHGGRGPRRPLPHLAAARGLGRHEPGPRLLRRLRRPAHRRRRPGARPVLHHRPRQRPRRRRDPRPRPVRDRPPGPRDGRRAGRPAPRPDPRLAAALARPGEGRDAHGGRGARQRRLGPGRHPRSRRTGRTGSRSRPAPTTSWDTPPCGPASRSRSPPGSTPPTASSSSNCSRPGRWTSSRSTRPGWRASTRTWRSCCWPPSTACPYARTRAGSGCANWCSTWRCSTTWRCPGAGRAGRSSTSTTSTSTSPTRPSWRAAATGHPRPPASRPA